MDPCSRGREVARGVLLSSPKPYNNVYFCHRRGIENFCRLFSTQQRPNVFVSDTWPRAPRITGCFVNTAVTIVQISYGSHWFCRSMSVEDSKSRCLKSTFSGVLSGRSWINICPGIIFFVYFIKSFSLDIFYGRFLCSQRELHGCCGGYRRNSILFLRHRVFIVVIGLHRCIFSWSCICPSTLFVSF